MLTSLSTYGYVVLFFYSLGGGMVAIIAAGVLSYAGKMDLSLSIAVATVANTLGDTMLFYIGRYNKQAVMPYIQKHKRKLAYSQLLMKRHGDKVVFLQKFVYGVKTLVPIAIGFTKYSFAKFTILNSVSSLIWAIALGVASFYMGEFFMNIGSYLGSHGWIMPVVMMSLLGSIWLYLQKVTQRRRVK